MYASHIGKSKKVGISWWSSGPYFHSRGHVQFLVGELGPCMPCGVTKKKTKQNKTKEKAQQQKQKGKKQIDEINLNDIFYLTQYNQRITMAT